MPHVYPPANLLHGKPKVRDGECVALIRHFTNAPPARTWKEGERVWGNRNIATGTAIATFENGKWPNRRKGNHAAFYVGQDSSYLYIIDQWNDDEGKKVKIERRRIPPRKVNADGTFQNPSDNALAFSVIK